MKLEEILPELRKGRRAKTGGPWKGLNDVFRISSIEILMCDKWELEPLSEQKITITRKQLADAWDKAMQGETLRSSDCSVYFDYIAAALGFGEEE